MTIDRRTVLSGLATAATRSALRHAGRTDFGPRHLTNGISAGLTAGIGRFLSHLTGDIFANSVNGW